MNDIISQYQKWKTQGEDLRVQAKTAIEVRYRELLLEAAQLAEEYRADFGATLKTPPAITSFRYKSPIKGKQKAKAKPKPGSPVKADPPAKPDPKIARLQKKLDTAKAKLDAAKAAGQATKNLEDKVYELEDDLRLAKS